MKFDSGQFPVDFSPNNGSDRQLMALASYDAVNGRVIVSNDSERIYDIAKLTACRFNQFKSYIQNGECTMDELVKMIMDRCGPSPKTKMLNAETETLAVWDEIQKAGESSGIFNEANSDKDLLSVILDSFSKGGGLSREMDFGGGRTVRLVKLPIGSIDQDPFADKSQIIKSSSQSEKGDNVKINKPSLYNANDEKWKKESSKAKPAKKTIKKARERNTSGNKGKKNTE